MRLAAAIFGSMRLKASRDICKCILTEEGASSTVLALHKALSERVAHIEDLRDKLALQWLKRSDDFAKWFLVDV